MGCMVVWQITELLHGHKVRPQADFDVAKLDRALTALARKARKKNLVAAVRQERQI